MKPKPLLARSLFLIAILLLANNSAKCDQKSPPVLAGANCAFWNNYVIISIKWYSDFYAETGIAFSNRDASIKTTTAIYEKTAYIAGMIDAYNKAADIADGGKLPEPRLSMKLKDYTTGVDVFCGKKENGKKPVTEALLSVNENSLTKIK